MGGFFELLYTVAMSKKKKRTKRYSGEDAKTVNAVSSDPVVHRYEAVERSRLGEWWQGRKRTVKVGGIIVGVLGVIGWLLFELFRIIT